MAQDALVAAGEFGFRIREIGSNGPGGSTRTGPEVEPVGGLDTIATARKWAGVREVVSVTSPSSPSASKGRR